MSLIHILDDSTINKIAAGEVVERPASVVKELVENAIDAGANRIEVEIMAGGTSFMRVTDNGCGMSEADAKLAILRHATSKIKIAKDLDTIATLGFRGEALPTIAEVSRFSLLTRKKEADLGTKITISGGKTTEIIEAGCAIGTTIKVEDLFFNTPARKKFLKTPHTEGIKINDFIVKLALSHPDIKFQFINNNKITLVTLGNGNLFDTLEAVYGNTAAKSLLALDFLGEDVKITGYITKPSFLKSSRAFQTYIVNSRVIKNQAIAKAIDNAYKSMIPKTGFPLAILNIAVPPRTIDVNVHPQKIEMKFEDESRIFKAVYKAVVDSIKPSTKNLTNVAAAVNQPEKHAEIKPMQFVPATLNFKETMPLEKTYAAPKKTTYPLIETLNAMNDMAVREEVAEYTVNQNKIIPLGQVDLTYIIAKDSDGLYIVDQHAAHERILFDRLAALADGGIPAQQLLVHQLLSFDEKETELIVSNQELFSHLGFRLEMIGDKEFRLIEVPADINAADATDLIREIMAGFNDMHAVKASEIRHHILATTACKAAIKAGEELNSRQMQLILDELAATPEPYTCPHGRPTILKFSSGELAKMFKRTGFNLGKAR